MKTVGDLSKYIKDRIDVANTDYGRNLIKESLAKEIANDDHMIFLLLAMSAYTYYETDVRKKVDDLMSMREKNKNRPKLKPLPEIEKDTKNFTIDPESFGGTDYPDVVAGGPYSKDYSAFDLGPIVSPEDEAYIKNLGQLEAARNQPGGVWTVGEGLTNGFDVNAAWIQTYSGRRFNPLKPNSKAIVIQDIAHALSMQCRFSGHCREFYSVAQHSVLVSHLCGDDALWGLLHDASETYVVDVPRPLKRSEDFQAYRRIEDTVQKAVCERFGLSPFEPVSVKKADKIMLATEARDLMSPLHPDWKQPAEPLPFTITSWSPKEAEANFIKRFDTLMADILLNYGTFNASR